MRKSGILLSISSLPSDYGIGTIGKSAYDFVDFLRRAGQRCWQILPISPVSFGNSPYQSFSAFAFNPYYIDLSELINDGLLTRDECDGVPFGNDKTRVDYAALYKNRLPLLKKAAQRFDTSQKEYIDFCLKNDFWLFDYAFFMAFKDSGGMLSLSDFPEDIKKRKSEALERFSRENQSLIEFYRITQYLFFKQWIKLKRYANDNGVHIIGDIPIYVSADSCDVWTHPELFCVNENLSTVLAAGCPPDDFSPDGQLWGNPVYNWQEHEKTHYRWWLLRLKQAYELFDVTRIDHFRGFYSYYCINAESKNAKSGEWKKANGEALMEKLKNQLPKMQIIAEDLGFITPDIRQRMDKSGFPGMKILQFGFDGDSSNEHLPHNFTENSVVYTGTHDNQTAVGWCRTLRQKDAEFALDYFDVNFTSKLPAAIIRAALSSVCETAIIPMQDYLKQNDESRMNIPSTLCNNWTYRITNDDMNLNLAERLRRQAQLFARL